MQKYGTALEALPATLHWFKWEAYATFITGLFLLILLYWYQAELYLIDPSINAISKPAAITLGVATLAGGWLLYDRLCKSRIGRSDRRIGICLLLLLPILTWSLCQVFSGRGAYIHFGALLGTIMVGNVFFVIMPAQSEMVAARQQSRMPDGKFAIHAKQRSVHNTYFTLPVLITMLSNHYSMLYANRWNWLILCTLTLIGVLTRVHFVQSHKGRSSPVPALGACVLLIGLFFAMTPTLHSTQSSQPKQMTEDFAKSSSIPLADIFSIVDLHCNQCHHSQPTHPAFQSAPQGIRFDTAQDVYTYAQLIYQQTVVSRAMPLGNSSGMTENERNSIASWFESFPSDSTIDRKTDQPR